MMTRKEIERATEDELRKQLTVLDEDLFVYRALCYGALRRDLRKQRRRILRELERRVGPPIVAEA